VGKSSSKRRHLNVKKSKASGIISTKSYSRKIYFEDLSSSDTESSVRRKRKRHSQSSVTKEFKKAKPPTFDGEIKKGEEIKAWLFGLKKYFRLHNYFENTKARISIFNLKGGASMRNFMSISWVNSLWIPIDPKILTR
jgi:hypothetical protein